MNMLKALRTLAVVALMVSAQHALAAEDKARASGGECNPLFNGKNLEGWSTTRPELWSVEEGVITGTGIRLATNVFLFTDKRYGDFELRYEARLIDDEGNSGVQIRSEKLDDGHAKGYQVDIGKGYWGSLYHELGRGMLAQYEREEGAESDPVKRDEFNEFVVRAEGDHIAVHLNGVKTVDLRDPEGERDGRIALQIHSGRSTVIQFRNIEIRELGPEDSEDN